MDWYLFVRELGERLASWPLLGVAFLFSLRLLMVRVHPAVAVMMSGIVLSMLGGWVQRLPFAAREWACRTLGHNVCEVVTGLHPLSVVGLYFIAVGALLHYRAAIFAEGWFRWLSIGVLSVTLALAIVPGLSEPLYAIFWPFVRSIAISH